MSATRKILLVFFTSVAAVFLQGTLLGSFLPKAMVPNFILILSVFIAFFESSLLGAFLAFFTGLVCDSFSGILLGPWAGASAVVFGMLTVFSRRIFVDAPLTAIVSVFLSALVGNIVYLFLLNRFAPSGSDIFSLAMIANCFTTAIVSPPSFAILKKIFVRRGHGLMGRYVSAYL